MDFDLHFGAMLASFFMFLIIFSSIDFTWICHQFFYESYIFVEVFLLISVVLHAIGETLKNMCFHILLHSLPFRKRMFFDKFRDMFRCSLFASFVAMFCTNGVILV